MFSPPFRYLTKAPHPGGSAFSNEQAEHIKKKWEEYGIDKVEMKKYDVLLSYPERPGIASIKTDNGSTLFTAQRKEKVLESSENNTNVLPPFNAYSSSGNVTVRLNADWCANDQTCLESKISLYRPYLRQMLRGFHIRQTVHFSSYDQTIERSTDQPTNQPIKQINQPIRQTTTN